ncbi:N-carbamoylsarcosine amidohydrolase [Tistrella mobilis]|uniref:N-carbamoylsarcosine amidohydrolase n=1 Tax=Tistrella mobilis TaxID=171437 RepID=UPI0035593535
MTADTDLTTDYQGAGFMGALGFGRRPALVIVDVVQAYFDPGSPLYAGVEDMLAAIHRLLAAARTAGIPVIFTNVEYQAGGADGGLFYRKVAALKVFDRGSPLGRFARGLEPASGEIVVTKQYASAFFGTSLASTLTARGVDTAIITGVSTSGCVRATALDALQHGFIPIVVREAVGDRAPGPHEANLFDLQAKYADVVGVEEVIARLGGEGPTPQSTTSCG